ncbi:hypothetical protein SAMN05421670_2568 [Psychrobacillus psychrotolerans]|uniref:Uncharacterized protein n=1 Tax=Psychrobacillus psychrotolerans TaxID=126156 RepID=A0A1I5ZAL8_9BACI|nr:hypothetical protein [Psychrobacillus psychrotolerans]SFQ53490.1 hypothetical protein SAMN05421670_2568 [Psychrobacillus psychrotolerans]
MKKYNISMIVYQDYYGKDIKLKVQEIELRDNTEDSSGYCDICLEEIKEFTLVEGDSRTFFFETDRGVHLSGEGKVQYDGKNGYCIVLKMIKLV